MRHKASTQLGNVKSMAMKLPRSARIALANRMLKVGHEIIASAGAVSECRRCGHAMEYVATLCPECDAILNPGDTVGTLENSN
jgi:RNase P subunit RPR2